MNYKDLQKLNEIIENLKATPNADENIQFVLDLADKSVKAETLEELMRKGNILSAAETEKEMENKNIISKNGQSNVITFTKKEILHMDKTFKKHFILNGYLQEIESGRTEKLSTKKSLYLYRRKD